MKPDTTSATLILSRKIRGVFWAVLGLVLMGSSANHNPKTEVNPKLLITPKTLKNIPLEQRVIVDTRSKLKFLMGHIPGAVNLDSWREFTSKKNGINSSFFQSNIEGEIVNKIQDSRKSYDGIIILFL